MHYSMLPWLNCTLLYDVDSNKVYQYPVLAASNHTAVSPNSVRCTVVFRLAKVSYTCAMLNIATERKLTPSGSSLVNGAGSGWRLPGILRRTIALVGLIIAKLCWTIYGAKLILYLHSKAVSACWLESIAMSTTPAMSTATLRRPLCRRHLAACSVDNTWPPAM